MKAVLLAMVFAIPAHAQEYKQIYFVCSNLDDTYIVAHNVRNIIYEQTQLPPSCAWTTEKQGEIIRDIDAIILTTGELVRIAEVAVYGRVGYSAGIADLIS